MLRERRKVEERREPDSVAGGVFLPPLPSLPLKVLLTRSHVSAASSSSHADSERLEHIVRQQGEEHTLLMYLISAHFRSASSSLLSVHLIALFFLSLQQLWRDLVSLARRWMS